MRETRLSGSEGGGTEANRFSLPLSAAETRRRDSQGFLRGSSWLFVAFVLFLTSRRRVVASWLRQFQKPAQRSQARVKYA